MPQSVGRKLTTSRERGVRIAEVEGSIPLSSTILRKITAILAVIFRLTTEIPVSYTHLREIADITIAADSLWELVELRQIAMALMARIHSNYRFVIGFNGTLIALGVAGVLPPATSATLHNLSTLGVSLRSMSRLTTQTQPVQNNNLQNG